LQLLTQFIRAAGDGLNLYGIDYVVGHWHSLLNQAGRILLIEG